MAWLFRLPRVLAVPVALALVALAGCALALLACSLPLILFALWVRRSLDEWRARRLLTRLFMLQGASPRLVSGFMPAHQAQPAAQLGDRPPPTAGPSKREV